MKVEKSYLDSITEVITHDIIKAYETHDKNDINAALESVKKIKMGDGSINPAIVMKLKKNDIKMVWGKQVDGTSVTKKLAAVYNGMAFEVG